MIQQLASKQRCPRCGKKAILSDTVTKKLQMINEINEATPVWGAYDVIAKVTAPTKEELRDAIRKKIRTTDNIRTTMSLMVTESQT